MVPCLHYKAKVVTKWLKVAGLMLALIFSSDFSVAQVKFVSSAPPRVSFSCRAMPFEDVVQTLSRLTGVKFIYSPHKLGTLKSVTVQFKNKTTDEVLAWLENEFGLTLIKRDGYVVINRREPSRMEPIIRSWTVPVHIEAPPAPPVVEASSITVPTDYQVPLPYTESPMTLASAAYFKQHAELRQYVDPNRIPYLPVQELRRLNHRSRHRGWFVAAGFTLNNMSGGVELTAGVRSLYAVVQPRVLNNGKYYGAYGVGTTVLLTNNFSLNPVYTFAALRPTAQTYESKNHRVLMNEKLSVGEHQMKLLLRYNITAHLSIKAGPTFSLFNLKSTSERYKLPHFVRGGWSNADVAAVMPVIPGWTNVTPATPALPEAKPAAVATAVYSIIRDKGLRTPFVPMSTTTSERELRIGWEASITYQINFFERR